MNDQIMVDTTDPLDNSCHQMKLPVSGMDHIVLSCWLKVHMGIPKQPTLLLKIWTLATK